MLINTNTLLIVIYIILIFWSGYWTELERYLKKILVLKMNLTIQRNFILLMDTLKESSIGLLYNNIFFSLRIIF